MREYWNLEVLVSEMKVYVRERMYEIDTPSHAHHLQIGASSAWLSL